MRCEPEPNGPSQSRGPISRYSDSFLSLEDFDLPQLLCSEEMLQWVSLFTQSPKERKQEEHVSLLKVEIPRTQRVLGLGQWSVVNSPWYINGVSPVLG